MSILIRRDPEIHAGILFGHIDVIRPADFHIDSVIKVLRRGDFCLFGLFPLYGLRLLFLYDLFSIVLLVCAFLHSVFLHGVFLISLRRCRCSLFLFFLFCVVRNSICLRRITFRDGFLVFRLLCGLLARFFRLRLLRFLRLRCFFRLSGWLLLHFLCGLRALRPGLFCGCFFLRFDCCCDFCVALSRCLSRKRTDTIHRYTSGYRHDRG